MMDRNNVLFSQIRDSFYNKSKQFVLVINFKITIYNNSCSPYHIIVADIVFISSVRQLSGRVCFIFRNNHR